MHYRLFGVGLFLLITMSSYSTIQLVLPYIALQPPTIMRDVNFFNINDLLFIQHATAQIDTTPVLVDRGIDNEIYKLGNTNQYQAFIGVKTWTFDSSTGKWVGINIIDNRALTNDLTIQSGLISVKFKNDQVYFYNANYTQYDNPVTEQWTLKNGASTIPLTFQSLDLIQNGNNANVTKTYSTSLGNYIVKYIFREGLPLKHEVTLQTATTGTYTTIQQWTLQLDKYVRADGTVVDVSALPDGSITVTKALLGDKLKSLQFQKTGLPVVFELLQSAWDNFISVKLTKAGATTVTVEFNYGTWTNGFTLDPDTFTSSSPTEFAYIEDDSNNNVCDTGSGGRAPTDMVRIEVSDSDFARDCRRGFFEWNITSIPDNATIDNTVFKFDVGSVTSSRNCDYMEINNKPSTSSDTTVFTDIGDGTVFVNSDTVCNTAGDNKSIDLGTSADSDVSAQLSLDWWAVGMKQDNETLDSTTSHTSDITRDSPVPAPTLEITYTLPSVTQPITITVANGGTGGTATLSGCGVTDTTQLMNGVSENHTADPSCTITVTLPADGANTRHRTSSSGTTYTIGTCASGTCTASSTTVYYELQNTGQVTANAQTTFDAGLTLAVVGTVAGTASTTICTIAPTGGAATGSCSGWGDYNRAITGAVDMSGAPANSRWRDSSDAAFTFATPTTGGNTYNRNEYKEWVNTFKYTVLLGGTPSAPSITCNALGSSTPTAIDTIGIAVYCDHSSSVTIPQTIAGAANERWKTASVTVVASVTAGGTTYNKDFYHQYNNTWAYEVTSGTPTAPTLTYKDVAVSTNVTLTLAGAAFYTDADTYTATNPIAGAPNEQWFTNEASGTVSSGGNTGGTFTISYYHQYTNNWPLTINLGGAPTIQMTCTVAGVSTPRTLSAGANNLGCDDGSAWSVPDPVAGAANERWGNSTTGTGLVGLWHFQNDALDESGNGNNGTITGATFVAGKIGKALSFDGVDDNVQVADANSLDVTAITISAWVNPTNFATTRTILEKDQQYGFLIQTNGKLVGEFKSNEVWHFTQESVSALSTNTWTHVVITYDGAGTVKIYISGILDKTDTTTTTGSIVTGTALLRIARNDAGSVLFNGIIDESRIYNRALTASEVTALFNLTNTVNNPIAGAANEQWNTPTPSQLVSSGGNTFNFNYYHQYNYTVGFAVAAGGNALGVSNTITVTCTVDNVSDVKTFNSGTNGTDLKYRDNNICTWLLESTGTTTTERWRTQDTLTSTPSAGGSKTDTYYNQLTLIYSTRGSPSPAPTINFTSFASSSSAPSLTGSPQTFWADRASTWTVANPITVSGTERYITTQTVTDTVSTTLTTVFDYRHDFNLNILGPGVTYQTANGKTIKTKPSSISVTMGNGTSFTDPNGWLGQVDGIQTNTVNTFLWVNNYNMTANSSFTISTNTTIALGNINADTSNRIQVGTVVTGGTTTIPTYNTSFKFFTWTATGTNGFSGDILIDLVDSAFQIEPTYIKVDTTKYVNDSPKWNYNATAKYLRLINIDFSSHAMELSFFTTDVSMFVFNEFNNLAYLDGNYLVEIFGSQNVTRFAISNGHSLNQTINSDVQYIKLWRSPNDTATYWRELRSNLVTDTSQTFWFYMANETLHPILQYKLFINDPSNKWTVENTRVHIHKQADFGGEILIDDQVIDAERKILSHLVVGENYNVELHKITDINDKEGWGDLKTDSTINKVLSSPILAGKVPLPQYGAKDYYLNAIRKTPTIIQAAFQDLRGNNHNVTMTLYNNTYTTTQAFTNVATQLHNFTGLSSNAVYIVKWTINTDAEPLTSSMIIEHSSIFPALAQYISVYDKIPFFPIGVLVFMGAIIFWSPRYAYMGALVGVGMLWFLWGTGILSGPGFGGDVNNPPWVIILATGLLGLSVFVKYKGY